MIYPNYNKLYSVMGNNFSRNINQTLDGYLTTISVDSDAALVINFLKDKGVSGGIKIENLLYSEKYFSFINEALRTVNNIKSIEYNNESSNDYTEYIDQQLKINVDEVTITGDGTSGNPLVASVPTKPYKVYTALLTQTGTNAPVATVLENTFTGSISFSYDDVGTYIILSSANEFVLNKTLTQIQVWGSDPKSKGRVGNVEYSSTGKLYLRVSRTVEPAVLTDGIGTGNVITSIEIRVYN